MKLDPHRLLADLHELARRTSDEHGAQRVAWTPTWADARAFLRDRLAELPVDVSVDQAGNLWASVAGESSRSVIIGSHLDSVPNGGWLDGCLGVLAAVEVLRTVAADRRRPRLTVRLVDWADEEGARFGHSLLGSSAVAGTLDTHKVAGLRDLNGITIADALSAHDVRLAAMPDAHERLHDVIAYVELHIEQGPVLERRDLALGVVNGTYGTQRHAVRFTGQASHAGSTPMGQRHDALIAAARLALEIRALTGVHGGVGTVGRIEATPGVSTAVAGEAIALVDQRHEDGLSLLAAHEAARATSYDIARDEGVEVAWCPLLTIDPIPFDQELIELAAATTGGLQREIVCLPSGPLHDAAAIARAGIPTVMLFVRSKLGLSHTPREDTDAADIALSLTALDRLVRTIVVTL